MSNKHLFKLSSITLALLSVATQSNAVECSVPMRVQNQSMGMLTSCSLNISATADELRNQSELLNVVESTLDINQANLTISGDYGIDLIAIADSKVGIYNSSIKRNNNADGEYLSQAIVIKEGRTGKSQLHLNNVSLSVTGESSAISVYSINKADTLTSVTLNDSKLSSDDELFGSWWTTSLRLGENGKNEYVNLDVQATSSDLQAPVIVSGGGLSLLKQEDGVTGSENINFSASNSHMKGAVLYVNDDKPYSTLNVNLDNSHWLLPTFRDNKENILFPNGVTNLALSNNSQITLSNNNGFQTFTIYENLTGNGHFDLNTDLANQKSDKIVVKGEDSGNFTLGIKDSGNEPQAANGRVTLVETAQGQAKFSLKDREYVDAGAYRYRLHQEGTNWVLANRQAERVTPPPLPTQPTMPATPSAQPVVPTDPQTPSQPATPVVPITPETPNRPSLQPIVLAEPLFAELSEKSNALVSLRQAQGVFISQNLQGIHQRLGELKTDKVSNVWVKDHNSRHKVKAQHVAADSRSSGFELDSYRLQIGADRAVSENVRLGGFVGTSRADVDFNGEYGKGKLRSQAVGFYGTFANVDGWYLDNVAKYERLTTQAAGEKRKYHAFGISSEIGKHIAFANAWTVTPQVQLTYHTISGKADENRLTQLAARAGVRVAKAVEFDNGWSVQPYVELNGLAEKTNSAKVRVNQYRFDVPENRSSFQAEVGLSSGLRNHRFGLAFSSTYGKQVTQPFTVQASYRYQW